MGALSPFMWMVLLAGVVLIVLGIVFAIAYFGYLMGSNKELRAKRVPREKADSTRDER